MAKDHLMKYFKYLDNLRASGVTNMYGSPRYVEKRFKISWEKASEIVGMWMRTFDPNLTVQERATRATSLE